MKIVIKGIPRTKKNSQKVVMRGKKPLIVQSDAYRAYEELALWQLPHPREPIRGPVNVKCTYYMPTKRRVDLLNLLAATMDILVKGRVLEDDNSKVVYGHDGSRVRCDRENPRVEIEISGGIRTRGRPQKRGREAQDAPQRERRKTMAEYVEKDKAIEACFDGYADCRDDCAENIRKLRAADVVEVVRCRDCKHAPLFWDEDDSFAVKWPQQGDYGVDDETCPHYVGDYSYTRPPDPDGFCEKGERKP